MKSLKSLFTLLTLAALSFACAPANQTPVVTETDQPEAEITIIDVTDNSCCMPILGPKPKL